jgi:hypothetical protein
VSRHRTNHDNESRSFGELGVDSSQDADDKGTERRRDVGSVDEGLTGEVVGCES